MTDPYLIKGTDCLKNKLDLRDPAKLAELEARIVAIRDTELATKILPGEYNLPHLQRFHGHLFQDVFAWAGKLRQVNISKPGVLFAPWPYLEDEVSAVLSRLKDDGWLGGLPREDFVAKLAFYYGEINARHPFREGNGRTQRAFLRQLSAAAGWRLDWSELSKNDNIDASRHNLQTADPSRLIEVLDPVVTRI